MTTRTEEHPTATVLAALNGGMSIGELTDLFVLLEFLTGQPLMSHQLGPATRACTPFLQEQLAHLGDTQAPPPVEGESPEQRRDTVNAWAAEKEHQFGDRIAVTTMPPERWTPIGPFDDVSAPVVTLIPFVFGETTP